MSAGINKGGQWLDGKIDKKGDKKVSDDTKQKFSDIKSKTKSSMKVAGYYLDKVFTPVADYTNKTINDISTSIDQGNNDTLKKIKEVTTVTGQSVNTAFTGLSSGAK